MMFLIIHIHSLIVTDSVSSLVVVIVMGIFRSMGPWSERAIALAHASVLAAASGLKDKYPNFEVGLKCILTVNPYLIVCSYIK